MMKKGRLRQELSIIREEQEGKRPRAVFISSYSLNPTKLMGILRYDLGLDEAAFKNTFVYFQRYSFREMTADLNEPPYVGAKRLEAIQVFEKKRKYNSWILKVHNRKISIMKQIKKK